MDAATIYATDPASQARAWQDQDCRWLHVVDLDGAIAGHPVNQDAVAAILAAASVPVQLGGGVRDMDGIERWLQAGVRRVILGTAAATDPALVQAACRAFPGRIAVGIDARDGFVATEGWVQTSRLTALDLARRFEQAGVAAIIYTDIARDGMLTGVNIEATLGLARRITTRVIASGGIGGLEDLRTLRREAEGVLDGVIVGRALYDGRIDVSAAQRILMD
jgi:phosphoribosylformimino-5-aminoimidazole carboxamide ribotide isomerase